MARAGKILSIRPAFLSKTSVKRRFPFPLSSLTAVVVVTVATLCGISTAPAEAQPGSETESKIESKTTPASEPAVVAVQKALPAVVNINTERVIRRTYRDPYDDIFYQFFGGGRVRPRELRQKVQSLGSGFIVDASGYIVTNEHVVERAEDLKIQVTTSDGKTYEAKYITGDAEADLALLKIEAPKPLPFISLADLSPNLLGQTVLVVGNPLGYGHSVARGILSAANRSIAIEDLELKNLLQTDAAINPGNSGGPLIDLSGKLVGVASAKMAYGGQGVPVQGIGFAIPASVVAEKVAAFRKEPQGEAGGSYASSAARKRFGLTLQDLTPDLSEAFGVEAGSGVLISDVEPGSPADESGLRRGIVIFHIGNYAVSSVAEAEKLFAKARQNSRVDMGVGIAQRRRGVVLQKIQIVSMVPKG